MLTSIQKISINSLESAIDVLKKALNDEYNDEQSYLVVFDNWPKFSYIVVGQNYHSSLPTGALRALASYQSAFNNFYARLAYNKTSKSLTDEDKKDLEFLFLFKEGSADTSADLQSQLTRLGEKAVEKMTGKEIIITVVSVALLATVYLMHSNHLDAELSMHQSDANTVLLSKAIEGSKALAELNTDLAKAAFSMVKSVPDASSITVGNLKIKEEEIGNFIQRDRLKSEYVRLDDEYRVVRISEVDAGYRIGVESLSGLQITVLLDSSEENSGLLQQLAGSVISKKYIPLSIMGKKRAGVIQEASILTHTHRQEEMHLFQDIDDDDDE